MRSISARKSVVGRIQQSAASVRDTKRPLIWFHAPSVGEGLQAKPLILEVQSRFPDFQLAYTFFSPSAEKFARSLNADICDYLPFDTNANARAILEALRPNALVFSKLDVWPKLVEEAVKLQVPCALVSATVAPNSGRLSAAPLVFLRDAYDSLTAVGAIDESNAQRIRKLGARAERVSVTGDTRFDQCYARARAVASSSALLAPLQSSRATVVAGSTWPSDNEVLLPAWISLLKQRESFSHRSSAELIPQSANSAIPTSNSRPRLIIAPHEPSERETAFLSEWARRHSLSFATLHNASADTDVVVVDTVGVLGELYSLANAAYVGGGFHKAGLHSVIEPAAFGVPVFFGAGHHMSREASLLINASAGDAAANVSELSASLSNVLFNAERQKEIGDNALQVVKNELGATERSLELILQLLSNR